MFQHDSQSIQQLMIAEKRAEEKVNQARKRIKYFLLYLFLTFFNWRNCAAFSFFLGGGKKKNYLHLNHDYFIIFRSSIIVGFFFYSVLFFRSLLQSF